MELGNVCINLITRCKRKTHCSSELFSRILRKSGSLIVINGSVSLFIIAHPEQPLSTEEK